MPVAMTIAGSDSGGGAGVQADLRAFAALDVVGTSAITCITAQNPSEVRGVLPVDPDMVRLQIETICDGFRISAVKTGMLYSAGIIAAVARTVKERELRPLVVDPVMVATSGAKLLRDDAVSALCAELLPLATVLTPNLPEAEILCGHPVRSPLEMSVAAREIADRFGVACVLKGGHLGIADGGLRIAGSPDVILDVLCVDGRITTFEGPRVNTTETHGTGCMFSAALAASLAGAGSIHDAVAAARQYVHDALVAAGRSPLPEAHG